MNDISFLLGQGGLNSPLPGEDHYSALIFYTATLPSGFTTSNRVKKFFSIVDAQNAGLNFNYADETKATATYTVTAIGATSDSVTLTVNEPFGVVVTLGKYIKTATETTTTLVAAAIAAAINLGTKTHGYTALAAVAVVTISARPGLGIFLNTGSPLVATYSAAATLAGTIVAFTGGVVSKLAVYYYHIVEFFRIQPKGVLFVGFYAVPGAYTFTEIPLMQTFAVGKIRQIGVYKDSAAFATADITALDTVLKAQDALHKGFVGLYAADLSGTADVSTLTDLSVLSANTVSAVISQDGAALGASLYLAYGKSITTLGATLGAVALSKVSESIGWVQKFNFSNGTECDVLAFANGVLYSNTLISDNLLDTLTAFRYVFLRAYVGKAGTYVNENSTSIIVSNDYAYINTNRVVLKAKRNIYTNVLPFLNGPLQLNVDGTLSDVSLAYVQGLVEKPLADMQNAGEISAFAVNIDTTQNVASTSQVKVTVTIVPIGVARTIVITIGYGVIKS